MRDPEKKREYMKKYLAAYGQRPEVKARERARYQSNRANPEWRAKRTAYLARYFADPTNKKKHADCVRNNWQVAKYGITISERDAWLEKQGGGCGICRTTTPGNKHGWHTDHCHTTGKVRGILCHSCNAMMAKTATIENLRRAIAYLEAFAKTQS